MISTHRNYSLLLHNTFGIDVKSHCFIEYETVDELKELISRKCVEEPFLHIGGGSNLLFLGDYQGTILHSSMQGIEMVGEDHESVFLRVGSGVVWDDFVAHCVVNNWYGAENLSYIPGEVGASAVQNIGAYGVEVKDLIVSVSTLNTTGEERVYTAGECDFKYRHSIFKNPAMKGVIVTCVLFRLSKKESYTLDYGTIREELKQHPHISLHTVRETIIGIRIQKLPDPAVLGNAGSFFMNPIVSRSKFGELKETYTTMPYYEVDAEQVKIPAGWLIEQSGWKGKSIGQAGVHDKQALVLVNRGGATGMDILRLSDAVRQTVKDMFGIDIRPEVKIISS